MIDDIYTYKVQGYIVMADDKYVCESNGRQYVIYQTKEELKKDSKWRPKFYHNLNAAKKAAAVIDTDRYKDIRILVVDLIYDYQGTVEE